MLKGHATTSPHRRTAPPDAESGGTLRRAAGAISRQPHATQQVLELRLLVRRTPQALAPEAERERIALVDTAVHPSVERGMIAQVQMQRGNGGRAHRGLVSALLQL